MLDATEVATDDVPEAEPDDQIEEAAE